MTVSSTSLRERGEMLLSRATADQEKEPWGEEGKPSSSRLGRILPPGVWRLWVGGGLSIRAGEWPSTSSPQQFPILSCQPLLWLCHSLKPHSWRMINGCRSSPVCLWRVVALFSIEPVEAVLVNWGVCAASADMDLDFPYRRASPLLFVLIWSASAPLPDKQLQEK